MARRKQATTRPLPTPAREAPLPTRAREAPAPSTEAVPERVWRVSVAAALVVYAVLQLLYLTATPLQTITLPDNLPRGGPQSLMVGIGPDEKEHFLYILSLANRGELPGPDPARRTSPEQYISYQAQHPPLFYGLAALVYRLTVGLGPTAVWYLLRGLCAVCGAGVIVLAARAARVAFPERPLVGLVAAPFVAFLPMFGHMTGNLSNEPLAMVFGAWAWLQMTRLARADAAPTTRGLALLGLTLGLAALTRLTALLWLPAAIVVLALLAARRERRIAPAALAAFAACFAVLVAPWFIRNQIVYATPLLRTFDRPLLEGITLGQYLANPEQPIQPKGFPQPIVVTPLSTALWYASTSWFPFWLVQFYLPGFPQAAGAWQAVFLLLSVGVVLALFLQASRARREGDAPDPAGRALLWAAGSALAFCVLALVQQQLFSDWNVLNSAGRYTVAAVPATALLCLFAVSGFARSPGGGQRRAAVLVAGLMLAFDLYTVLLVRRFYADNPRQAAVQPITMPGTAGGVNQ